MGYHYSISSLPHNISITEVRFRNLSENYPETVAIIKELTPHQTEYLMGLLSEMSSQTFACFVDLWNRIGKPILDMSITPDFGYKKIQNKILKVYPESRGNLFLYSTQIPNDLLTDLGKFFGISSYGFVGLAYVLRNVYGEKAIEEVLERIKTERMIFTPVEIMKVLEKWGEIGDYPLKWGVEILSELK